MIKPPAWGRLEALAIPLGNPDEIRVDQAARLRRTSWWFEGYNHSRLEQLWRECGLTESQQAGLRQPGVCTESPTGLCVNPPDAVVWSLAPPTRAQLYAVLAHHTNNVPQCNPFRFALGHFESRLAVAGLPPEKLARLRQLTYTNSQLLCLADLQLLPPLLTPPELDRLYDALFRVPGYRLRLRITPETDLEALLAYWGRYGREKLLRPLVESMARIPNQTNGATLSLGYFFPPAPRTRLFTYPSDWSGTEMQRADCFWTSLNFFRDPPEAKFLDPAEVRRALTTEYEPASNPPLFGDIVVLLDSQGSGIHACVYLAEDFVFTKNGKVELEPWVIMKMSDMLACFPSEQPLRMMALRLKQTPAGTLDSSAANRSRVAGR